ncbi:MAG: HNH endonuclease [Dongiaceae bacterium]
MGINLVVAVTDADWFAHLRQLPSLNEANFWAPSPKRFRALQPGELFLFKLHAPHNVIVGGGVFAYANVMPCSLAWSAFGESNGAKSAQEMRSRIARYRRGEQSDKSDFDIGCRILTQPFFLDESEWIDIPTDWSPNIVSFKTYNTDEPNIRMLWEKVSGRSTPALSHRLAEERPRFGEPYLLRPRLGQGAFRILVTDTYNRRCAVTRERVLPALDAAHIRPYSEGGEHEVSNGILLRRDIHSLFDAGYVTITPDLHFEVSRSIQEEFDNGKHYYALHGKSIELPANAACRPDANALAWHNEQFKG